MTYLEYEAFLSESNDYLKARIEHAKEQFGIGMLPRYEYDLYRGEIWWSEVGAPKVRGRVTVVGSISTRSNTWLWSWANPHFADIVLGDIRKVRDFGATQAIAKLSEQKWEAEEVDGWEMTAIAARLLEAQGAYRSPDEDGFLFLLYDHLELIPAAEMDRYMPLKRGELGKSQDWPFPDPKNVVTFTVRDIIEKRAPILLVTHEESDGMWQFLTGGQLPEKKDWLLVALSEIVGVDPTVKELADLPVGYAATRASVADTWSRSKSPENPEDDS
jgi:hypothetical protein